MINVQKGLDLPIIGAPKQEISDSGFIDVVGIIAKDFNGMKPSMLVKVGDQVKIGQGLFYDKKNDGVLFTSPAGGKIVEINRGSKRVFQSIVIDVDENKEEHEVFKNFRQQSIDKWDKDSITKLLVESGQWVAFRTRPFSKTPIIGSVPKAIFINCMDTNPLAADPSKIIAMYKEDFRAGVKIISKLIDGKIYLCKEGGKKVEIENFDNVEVKEFKGKHPAGNVGTHIHFLCPVNEKKNRLAHFLSRRNCLW